MPVHESFGVTVASSAADAVLSRQNALRFQFRTTSSFEHSGQAPTAEDRTESFFDVLNAGRTPNNKYLDFQKQSPELLPSRKTDTKYAWDYRKKPNWDAEANTYLSSNSQAALGTLNRTQQVPTSWNRFQQSRYNQEFKERSDADKHFAKPFDFRFDTNRDTMHVIAGRGDGKLQESKSHAQDTHSAHAVALPPGMSAALPATEPVEQLGRSRSHLGHFMRSSYMLANEEPAVKHQQSLKKSLRRIRSESRSRGS
eukprot:TRINITY_DN38267_c0_g2_i1.p1 TRINITY_DN38267_c0_g2~~TRINITY_DN38267_c0_g2_i1.p1  ORF type:complete len:255 (+),score=34.28 TRINITY_DN38267_c0_g2_i1:152-916(+)